MAGVKLQKVPTTAVGGHPVIHKLPIPESHLGWELPSLLMLTGNFWHIWLLCSFHTPCCELPSHEWTVSRDMGMVGMCNVRGSHQFLLYLYLNFALKHIGIATVFNLGQFVSTMEDFKLQSFKTSSFSSFDNTLWSFIVKGILWRLLKGKGNIPRPFGLV